MNEIAEQYVRLVLAVGQHDTDYVDAFYGPAEWKAEAERQKVPLEKIGVDGESVDGAHSRAGSCDRRLARATPAVTSSAFGTSISGGSSRRSRRACACCRARN